VVHCNSIELHQVYGIVQNAITKLQLGRTMSTSKNCKAKIQISFKTSTSKSSLIVKSIHSALNPDIKSSSDPVVRTGAYIYNSNLYIEMETSDVPSLRAIINSYLRLTNASYKSIAD
jgi:tRNA threonylcarbamoyladenosine modification (KEOPS) complex  Pcc1 subunit